MLHGYLRTKGGTFTTFEAPGAGTGAGQGTVPENLNPSRTITGQYLDASGVNHGFAGAPGVLSTFDAPGAGTAAGQGTVPISNDPMNGITGFYIDGSGVFHGFLRTK